MKTVTMNRALRPFGAGDVALLPDDLADQLVASGDARDPAPYPPGSEPDKRSIAEKIVTGTLRLSGKLHKKGLPT